MTDEAIDKAWNEYVSAQYGPPQALRKREFIAGWKAAQHRITELEGGRARIQDLLNRQTEALQAALAVIEKAKYHVVAIEHSFPADSTVARNMRQVLATLLASVGTSALADYRRRAQEQAWDEGYGDDLECTRVRENPYRATENGAAHNADEPTAEDYATGTYAPGAAE